MFSVRVCLCLWVVCYRKWENWRRPLGDSHARRVLKRYFEYYHEARTHLGLDKDSPIPRAFEPPHLGPVELRPKVGGLHSRYYRRAA